MTDREVDFFAFDPEAEVDITYGHLPHWFQPGVVVFITFRLADSMPREAIRLWERQQRDWLTRRKWLLEPDEPLPKWEILPRELQFPFRKYRESSYQEQLDHSHGACHLRNRKLAEIVLDSLRHFDKERYELDCAIIMPNHVHLLAMFHLPTTCRNQCTSWTHFTATNINRIISQDGAFWQTEPFDHLVRSSEQFAYLRYYIANNGSKAKLPEEDYLYWKNF